MNGNVSTNNNSFQGPKVVKTSLAGSSTSVRQPMKPKNGNDFGNKKTSSKNDTSKKVLNSSTLRRRKVLSISQLLVR